MHEFSDTYELLSLINVSYPACRFIKNLNIDPSYTFAHWHHGHENFFQVYIKIIPEDIRNTFYFWQLS